MRVLGSLPQARCFLYKSTWAALLGLRVYLLGVAKYRYSHHSAATVRGRTVFVPVESVVHSAQRMPGAVAADGLQGQPRDCSI